MKQIDLNNKFYLSLNYGISILETYDYKMSYMENVARNFTKKYPSYLVHKKSEDKIKVFLTDMVKTKVETFVNAEAKNVTVTEVRELSDLIAEYEERKTLHLMVSIRRTPLRWEAPAWSLP